jgi:hypothetical protein
MALYVILMAFLVHLPRAMGHELDITTMAVNIDREKELEMVNFFRNIMVTGALLAFAEFVAKDKRVIGKIYKINYFVPAGFSHNYYLDIKW